MGGDVQIKQTKRSTYRSMNSMNGDFLSQLKKPVASELSQGLRGQNGAHREILKKQVDQWYKERDIALGKLSRGQEAVYGTLLDVHKHKKVLQRETWKRHQDESRRQAEEDRLLVEKGTGRSPPLRRKGRVELDPISVVSQLQLAEQTEQRREKVTNNPTTIDTRVAKDDTRLSKGDTTVSKHRSTVTKDDSLLRKDKSRIASDKPAVDYKDDKLDDKPGVKTVNEMTIDDNPAESGRLEANPSREVRTRVLEVRKGDPSKPLVRERSKTQIDLSREPSGVKDLPENLEAGFGSINELVKPDAPGEADVREGIDVTEVKDANSTEERDISPKKKKRKKKKSESVLKPQRTREPTLPRISESPGGGPSPVSYNPTTPSVFPSPSGRSYGTLPLAPPLSPSRRAASEPQLSQIQMNKRRARQKERRRREILDREGFTLYMKNRKGDIVASDSPWRRKDFAPPSMREKAFQQKMLKAQTRAIDDQMQKLEIFMEKIDAEERAKRRMRDMRRQQDDDERRAKDVKPKEEVGVTLQQLVAAFVRSDALPEGMDPDSFEAMQFCKYVRSYSPITAEEKAMADRHKRSSWKKHGDYI